VGESFKVHLDSYNQLPNLTVQPHGSRDQWREITGPVPVDFDYVRRSTCVSPEIRRHVRLLRGITVLWLLVESAVSLFAASGSRNLSLAAFGGDSLVELLSRLFRRSFGPKLSVAKAQTDHL
jgi:hypothetical protein